MQRRTALLTLALAAAFALSACSAPAMKGTPFYTGEYEAATGAPEDRVNLWPLLYYRRPALSVLWPIGEYVKNEHLAVRPLFSVYDLAKQHPVVNVLWPLCRFASGVKRNRIFPAYWGRSQDDRPYFVLFPFIWYSQGRHVGVFPLFLDYAHGDDRSRHLLWPIFNRKQDDDERGWRLWPLYGHYEGEGRSRRYALWPLLMSLRDGDERLRWAAPFYFGGRSPESAWDLLLPIFYRYKSEDESRFLALPFLYESSDSEGGRTLLTPVYMTSREGEDWWKFVAPTYFARQEGAEKQSTLFPLYHKWTDGQARMLLTLPYGFKESGESRTIFAFPLLSAYSRSPEGKDLWAVYPLSHWQWNEEGVQKSHVFPFYYAEDGLFLSLPFSRGSEGDQQWWNVLGPVFHKSSSESGRAVSVLWPLIGAKAGGEGRRSHAWPLYAYENDGGDRRLQVGPFLGELSLIGRSWSERKQSWWLFPAFGGESQTTRTWGGEQTPRKMAVQDSYFVLFPLVWDIRSEPVEGADGLLDAEREELRKASRDRSRRDTVVFPLWGYHRRGRPDQEGATGSKKFRGLGPLYDSEKRVTEREDDSGELDTYVRRRVLWRLMHYERKNDHTTLDVFPGITCDKEPGERKVFSFLWRVFRYDWDREKGTKVHVLFIPFGG